MYEANAVLPASDPIKRMRTAEMTIVLLAFMMLYAASPASAAIGQMLVHNTPPYVGWAKNLGMEDPSKVIDVTIWLNLHNRDQMDALAHDLYDPRSPNYRQWLTGSKIAARFGPTRPEVKTVEQFFEAHNLKVVKIGPGNFFVRARGMVGDVERAFHVILSNYQVQNKIIRANASDPYVEGPTALLVRSIAGLDSGEYEHPLMARPTIASRQKLETTKIPSAARASFYTSNCFDGVVTQKFSTNGDGELPIGTYTGNHLNLQTLSGPGCGYTPAPIQTAYGLKALYQEGYTGTGQTIVIIDWCGSTTIRNDANAFSRQFGLPLLNFTTFHVIETPRASQCMAADQTEINIDVEWAHAIAPSANIDLVVPPSATFQDVDQAEFYAVNYSLGNSLSGSYDSPESLTPPSVLATENLISEIAAISGISTNFSSGDNGDFTADGLSPTVSAPADSPWATSVGGVSLALSSANSIAWQSGWGNNDILLTQTGQIYDPPSSLGFAGGAGGGPSNCVVHDGGGNCLAGFPKPSFQRALPGKYRQVPDVAWLADPFTGVVIAISVPGQVPGLVWQVWGGTSVACPMFSALWAIANQEAGAPLGQAAQYLYSLPRGAIIDVVPLSTRTNVKASIQVLGGIHNYNARQVLGGAAPVNFISALWDYPWEGDTALAISFGTDCTAVPNTFGGATLCDSSSALRTEVGWDNVTGVGTPNGKVFGDSFKPPAAGNHP